MRRLAVTLLSLYALTQVGCGWCQRPNYWDPCRPSYAAPYSAPAAYSGTAASCVPMCVPCAPQVQSQTCPPGCAPIGTTTTTIGPTGR